MVSAETNSSPNEDNAVDVLSVAAMVDDFMLAAEDAGEQPPVYGESARGPWQRHFGFVNRSIKEKYLQVPAPGRFVLEMWHKHTTNAYPTGIRRVRSDYGIKHVDMGNMQKAEAWTFEVSRDIQHYISDPSHTVFPNVEPKVYTRGSRMYFDECQVILDLLHDAYELYEAHQDTPNKPSAVTASQGATIYQFPFRLQD